MLDININTFIMFNIMLIKVLQILEITVILIFIGVAYNKFKNKK